jgi:hypothetical protein
MREDGISAIQIDRLSIAYRLILESDGQSDKEIAIKTFDDFRDHMNIGRGNRFPLLQDISVIPYPRASWLSLSRTVYAQKEW